MLAALDWENSRLEGAQLHGYGGEHLSTSAAPCRLIIIHMTLAAIGQLTSTASLTRNGQAAAKLIKQAALKGARAIFLPEASDYITGTAAHSIELAQPVDQSPFIAEIRQALADTAESTPIYVSVGIHEPTDSGNRVKNTLLWLDPTGKVMNRYQKIHLFDVEVANGPILRESQSVEAGSEVMAPFESPLGRIGAGICYDMRFPEHALSLRTQGAEILLFPSAFTVKTGEAHWHLLSRSRAVDNQCYVINAAQVGVHDFEGKRESYGHALVVNPWGEVIAEATDKREQVIFADIDLDALAKVRVNMPLWEQRPRPGPYGELF